MSDKEPFVKTASSSADDWATVTPHDSTNFTFRPRAIWVGGAGNVVAVSQAGTVKTFVGVPAGTLLPIRPVRINSTSTTATAMLALY